MESLKKRKVNCATQPKSYHLESETDYQECGLGSRKRGEILKAEVEACKHEEAEAKAVEE